jgi:hypothetical protein
MHLPSDDFFEPRSVLPSTAITSRAATSSRPTER